ncbi:WD40 repeat domain-containing protein [Nitrospira sp. Nam80]
MGFRIIQAPLPSALTQRTSSLHRQKTSRVWDVNTGTKLGSLKHEDSVASAAFSSNGQRVVTASWDRTARLWDVRWLTQYKGQEQIQAACDKKLGARLITEEDVKTSVILSGRKGEDVCAQSSIMTDIASVIGLKM